MFFTEPVPAAQARKLGFALAPEGFLLTHGSPANPGKGHGIEVFPKQYRLGKKGFGNLVWLPWWHGAEGKLPRISWSTTIELNNVGFRVFRAEGDPLSLGAELTSAFIAGEGDEFSGSTYEFNDTTPYAGGDQWYYVAGQDIFGVLTFFGPVQITVGDPKGVSEWMVY